MGGSELKVKSHAPPKVKGLLTARGLYARGCPSFTDHRALNNVSSDRRVSQTCLQLDRLQGIRLTSSHEGSGEEAPVGAHLQCPCPPLSWL